jgi:hypothetical protein
MQYGQICHVAGGPIMSVAYMIRSAPVDELICTNVLLARDFTSRDIAVPSLGENWTA